jgi:hypothetical protein
MKIELPPPPLWKKKKIKIKKPASLHEKLKNLHPFMIHLYTKYNFNPSNHHGENEQKLSFSRSFLIPRAITSPIIIGQHPYSNLRCISSRHICIPNLNPSNHQ